MKSPMPVDVWLENQFDLYVYKTVMVKQVGKQDSLRIEPIFLATILIPSTFEDEVNAYMTEGGNELCGYTQEYKYFVSEVWAVDPLNVPQLINR